MILQLLKQLMGKAIWLKNFLKAQDHVVTLRADSFNVPPCLAVILRFLMLMVQTQCKTVVQYFECLIDTKRSLLFSILYGDVHHQRYDIVVSHWFIDVFMFEE